MRKLAAGLFAVPVLLGIYLAALARSGRGARVGAGLAAGLVIALVAVAVQAPPRTTAVPASAPSPVAAEVFQAVRTGHPLVAPFRVRFTEPMDPASVAGALRISPDTAVTLSWDGDARVVTLTPVGHWRPGTLYTVIVDRSARSTEGGGLATPLRQVFLTAGAGVAVIAPTRVTGIKARLDSAFRITLDRPLAPSSVETALRIRPNVPGRVVAGESPTDVLFVPAEPLAPATTYRLWLEGLADRDGVPFASVEPIEVRTVSAPRVVRFRPLDKSAKVDRLALLSVRFTQRMNRERTAAAFHVTADGNAVKGTTRWAEDATVLVFRPAVPLPYGARITMTVDDTARSREGAPLDAAASGTFTIEPKPNPRPKPKPGPTTKPISRPGGGAASGSWRGVESYYLKLMNCTRTGGWVTSTGKCSSPGGRNVAPLALSSGISNKVARPYAKLLATRGLCSHFIGGNPGDRLRRAGFKSYRWAENLGCRSGNPYSAVLGSHRYFQSEKPYLGGHYVNMMNAAYDRAGIGVWVSGGRVRLVVDFYHP